MKFHGASTFATMEKALSYASNMANDCDILEYGIMELPAFNRLLKPISVDEACQVIDHHFSGNYD